jgi:hypothetical protein
MKMLTFVCHHIVLYSLLGSLVLVSSNRLHAQDDSVAQILRDAVAPQIRGDYVYREPILTGKPCDDAETLKLWLADLRQQRLDIKEQRKRGAPALEARRKELQREMDARRGEAFRSSQVAQDILALAEEEKTRLLAARDQCVELRQIAIQKAMSDFNAKYEKYMADEAENARLILEKKKQFGKRCAQVLQKNEQNQRRIEEVKRELSKYQNRSLSQTEGRRAAALDKELEGRLQYSERLQRDIKMVKELIAPDTSLTHRDVEELNKQRGEKFNLIKSRLSSHEQRLQTNRVRIENCQQQIEAYHKKWARVGPNSRGGEPGHQTDYANMSKRQHEIKLLRSQNGKLETLIEGYRHVVAQEGTTFSWTRALDASEIRSLQADLADAASQETLPGKKKTWEKLYTEWTDEDQQWATKVAAQAFLGVDPAILMSHNHEAILAEMVPALKVQQMDRMIATYEHMVAGIDGATLDYLESKIEGLRELKQEIRQINLKLHVWNRNIERMGEAYMAWLRTYKGNRRACRQLRGYFYPVRIDYSNKARLTAKDTDDWAVKPGHVLASVSGKWERRDVPENAHFHGTFPVPYGGKLHGEIQGSPPVQHVWSLGNGDTGLVVTFEPRLGKGYGPAQKIFHIGGMIIENDNKPLEGGGEWPGPGRLKVWCPPASGTGPLTGCQFEQSYSGTVRVTEIYPSRLAIAGTSFNEGDRIETAADGSLMASTPNSRMWLGKATNATVLKLKSESQPRNVFDLRFGRARIKEARPNPSKPVEWADFEFQFQLKGLADPDDDSTRTGRKYTLTPMGTEYAIEHAGDTATVRVFEGTVVLKTEGESPIQVPAGQSIELPQHAITPFDPAAEKPPTVQGVSAWNIPLAHDPIASYAESTILLDDQGHLMGDWVWQDPDEDATLESPEPGTLHITVPPGNEFWGNTGSAPRLLHPVSGDFDLECELLQECEGNHFAITEFVLYSPGSYIGQLAKQSSDPLMAHYRLMNGGWSRSENSSKLPLYQTPRREFPETPNNPVQLRFSRRGSLFESYWSVDGTTWNLSTHDEVDVDETVWVGLMFKRVAHDRLHEESSVNTIRNLRLTSDAELPPNEWRYVRVGGEAARSTPSGDINLSLDGSCHGHVSAIHHRKLEGDVDVVVQYHIADWDHAAGMSREVTVALSALDEKNQAYAGFHQNDSDGKCVERSDVMAGGNWGHFKYRYITGSPKSGYLRIVRRDGVFQTYHWRNGTWRAMGKGDAGFTEPVSLTLRIANNDRATEFAPLSATFSVKQILDGEMATAAPEWEPLDLDLFAEVTVPQELNLPDDLDGRMWHSPFPLGRLFASEDGKTYIFSNTVKDEILVSLDPIGSSRIAWECPAFVGKNRKSGILVDDQILVAIDYWHEAGSPLGGIYRVAPEGDFEQIQLGRNFGDTYDLVRAGNSGYFFSDVGDGDVWYWNGDSAEVTGVLTGGDKLRAPADLAWDEQTKTLYVLCSPSSKTSAIFAIQNGVAQRVAQATEEAPYTAMALSPGGAFRRGIHVLDSAGRLAHVNGSGVLDHVLDGLGDFTQFCFEPTGSIVLVGGANADLVLRIERSPLAPPEFTPPTDLLGSPVTDTVSSGNSPVASGNSQTSIQPPMPPTVTAPDQSATPATEAKRGYVGINSADVEDAAARQLGVTARSGAVVVRVYPGSPAEAAGLRAGDVIHGCGRYKTRTRAELAAVLGTARPGEKFVLDVEMRDGGFINYSLTLGTWPEQYTPPPAGSTSAKSSVTKREVEQPLIGIWVQSAGSPAALAFGIESPTGAAITRVQANSPGALAGLRRGDLVVEFAGKEVNNYEEFEAASIVCAPGSRQRVVFVRNQQRYATEMILGRRTGTMLIYSDPQRAYQIHMPATWKITSSPEKRADTLRSRDDAYILVCHHASRDASTPAEALDAFVGRTLRTGQGQIGRIELGGATLVFVGRSEGDTVRTCTYHIAFVSKGRLFELTAHTPVLNDPQQLPFVIQNLLGGVLFNTR